MKPVHHTEVAVVGGGIAGLALAYTAARAGKRVTVFERDSRPVSASIRNFGMIWPVGQPSGPALEAALRSREIWLEVLTRFACWHHAGGSLLAAMQPDEWAVLEEFQADAPARGYQTRLLSAREALAMSPALRPDHLLGALWSETEVIVDPREVLIRLMRGLEAEWGVQFQMRSPVLHLESGRLETPAGSWACEQIFVCTGSDIESFFPELYERQGVVKVKLQMLRTAPQPNAWHMGPALSAGLTLTHYGSFAHCQGLTALRERISAETPWFPAWGIHVMMSQNGLGELIIGDSHEYGSVHEPFLREEIDQYILDYLRLFAQMPDPAIAERWYGVYAKTPGKPVIVAEPLPGVTVFGGLGGAGMTLSFGLAEAVWNRQWPLERSAPTPDYFS